MCGVPPLILNPLISSVVSLAELVSSSVALPADLVYLLSTKELEYSNLVDKATSTLTPLLFQDQITTKR